MYNTVCIIILVEETTLTAGHCDSGSWTGWGDYDNPSGTGDWELLQDRTDACPAPTVVEGRVKETHESTTTEVVRVDVAKGIWCENKNQIDGSCMDYEVRFCCTKSMLFVCLFTLCLLTIIDVTKLQDGECKSGKWTAWDDRDNPGGSGDWEILNLRSDYGTICKEPSAVQGRVVETGAMETTQVVRVWVRNPWLALFELTNHNTRM